MRADDERTTDRPAAHAAAGAPLVVIGTDFSLLQERLGARAELISLRGEIDLPASIELRQRLVAAIDRGVTHVVVDMTAASSTESTTLAALVHSLKRLQQRGGELIVACTSPHILRTFDIAGLDQLLTLVPSRAAALARARGASARDVG